MSLALVPNMLRIRTIPNVEIASHTHETNKALMIIFEILLKACDLTLWIRIKSQTQKQFPFIISLKKIHILNWNGVKIIRISKSKHSSLLMATSFHNFMVQIFYSKMHLKVEILYTIYAHICLTSSYVITNSYWLPHELTHAKSHWFP